MTFEEIYFALLGVTISSNSSVMTVSSMLAIETTGRLLNR